MTELIKSISIEGLLQARDAYSDLLDEIRDRLEGIDELFNRFGVSRPDLGMQFGYGSDWLKVVHGDDRDKGAIRREIDRQFWLMLFQQSGVSTVMSSKAREDLYNKLHGNQRWSRNGENEIAPLTRENIENTFEGLAGRVGEFFDDSIEAVAKKITWDYKTNTPGAFSKKFILNHAIGMLEKSWNGGSWRISHSGTILDLEAVLRNLAKLPPSAHGIGLRALGSELPYGEWIEVPGDLMCIKGHKNGNMHVIVHDQDLIDQMNRVMARRYPGQVAAPTERRTAPKTPRSYRGGDLNQFFTPEPLARHLVNVADVTGLDVLEPSAGSGRLVEACLEAGVSSIHAVEIDPKCAESLDSKVDHLFVQDFLEYEGSGTFYDIVVMNPPFSSGREAEHVLHALKFAPKVVAIMSASMKHRRDGWYEKLWEALNACDSVLISDNEEDAFRDSGTMVRTVIVEITQ